MIVSLQRCDDVKECSLRVGSIACQLHDDRPQRRRDVFEKSAGRASSPERTALTSARSKLPPSGGAISEGTGLSVTASALSASLSCGLVFFGTNKFWTSRLRDHMTIPLTNSRPTERQLNSQRLRPSQVGLFRRQTTGFVRRTTGVPIWRDYELQHMRRAPKLHNE